MRFFRQQDEARRRSRWLVLWYAGAVLAVIGSYCAAATLFYAFVAFWGGEYRTFGAALTAVPPPVLWAVTIAVAGSILAVSVYRMWQLSEGGPAVAGLLGARYVEPGRATPAERRLLNIVEEMSIASGIAVPPVYILDHDSAINALVAGHSPNEAVIVVTHGAVERLSRDELQGVMGHEFSHILNGDMALNVKLVGFLAGLTFLADAAERIVYRTAEFNRGLPREKRGVGAPLALIAALVALIGFPATLAADTIKAAISRERERLADAAALQFTRNPDAVAGALDSILAMRAHTAVRALHCDLFSHMFFAQAVHRWWSPPTHPPIGERIERAHARFRRDEYRARRHGMRKEVAVIDGGGNVVKNVAFDRVVDLLGAAAPPAPPHVDRAAQLLARLPSRLREALRRPDEAQAVVLALLPGDSADAKARELQPYVGVVARDHMLTLAELAVTAIREQPQAARDAFLHRLAELVEADGRMTLREFVLLTLLRQRLREGAGQPIRTQYRRVDEVAADAHVVVSLVALSGPHAQAAFAKGAAVLGLGWEKPASRIDTKTVGEALERLRHLSPFAKPAVLKACLEAARADGVFQLAQTELVRMVAATLDCPVPPTLPA